MTARLIIAVVAFCIAFFATDAIYSHSIVPRLSEVREVPMLWWLGASLPLLLAPLVAGWRASSLREVAFLAPCGAAAYLLFLAAHGQLSGGSQHDVEGGALVLFNAVVLSALAFLVAALGWAARRIS